MAGALWQPTEALVNARKLANAPELVNAVLISPQKADLIKLKLQRELRRARAADSYSG